MAQGGAGGSSTSGGNSGYGYGGGLDVNDPKTEFFNDTIYGNSAIGGSGPIAGFGAGGGIGDETAANGRFGSLNVIQSTIVGNTAQAGVTPQGLVGTTGGGGIESTTFTAIRTCSSSTISSPKIVPELGLTSTASSAFRTAI